MPRVSQAQLPKPSLDNHFRKVARVEEGSIRITRMILGPQLEKRIPA